MGAVRVSARVQWRNSMGQFSDKISRAGVLAIEEASREGVDLAAAFAPKKTRALAGGIHTIGSGASGGWATGRQKYALPQEKGAHPHLIGDEGQFLSNKPERFAARGPVMHPGNPATRFMARAFAIVAPKLAAKVGRHL